MNPDVNVNLSPPASEAAPAITEQASQPSQTDATNGQSNSSPMLPFTNNPVAAIANPAPAAVPVGDDTDESSLEAEWVTKAKQIVLQTANDPFEQNKQLSAVKADYLQKRYGKVIKLAE